jgi:ferredoxin
LRVYVDWDLCRGHALCEAACPEIFHVEEEDCLAHVLIEHPGEELRSKVQEAVDRCPEEAISILDDET